MQFDTGSTLLWLKDKDKDEFDLPTTYRSPKSSTWKPTLDAQGKPVTIASKYGGGEIHGYIGEETVNLGGLVLEHQQFGQSNILDPNPSQHRQLLGRVQIHPLRRDSRVRLAVVARRGQAILAAPR